MAIYQGNKELTLNNVSTIKHGGMTVYRYFYPAGTVFNFKHSQNYDYNLDLDAAKLHKTNQVRLTVTDNYFTEKKIFSQVFNNVAISNASNGLGIAFDTQLDQPWNIIGGKNYNARIFYFWLNKYGNTSYLTIDDNNGQYYTPIKLEIISNHS